MKRRCLLALVAVALVPTGILGAGIVLIRQSKVPPDAIASSVTRTPELVERAWRLPVAATFNRQLTWQSIVSRCGPAAVANIYRSLKEAAATEAKVLVGGGWTGMCIIGLTLDELADVARVNMSRSVTVLRYLTEEQFREHLRRSNVPGRRYIVNFNRERIFGAGGGHHSPIGGYLEHEDLVFALDVNSQFQPWLVERSRLFSAVNTHDGDKK